MANMMLSKLCKSLLVLLISIYLVNCTTSGVKQTQAIPKASLSQVQDSYGSGNYQQALEDLSILAIDGNAEAQYALGYMYYYGQGTEQNLDLAKGWFQEAADNGFGKAQQALDAVEASETPPA